MLFCPAIALIWEGTWRGPHVEPLRRLYDTELVYVSAGAFELRIADAVHPMRPGSIAVIPPGAWHESRLTAKTNTTRHCVHFRWLAEPDVRPYPVQAFADEPFHPKLLHLPPLEIAPLLPLISHLPAHRDVLPVLRRALAKIRRRQAMGTYLLWPVLRQLLEQAAGKSATTPHPAGKTARAVLAVRNHIETRYPEPQDYRTYRKLTGLSTSHLCHAFTTLIGRPPQTYLNDLRLHHARRLLQETAMNVAEVAAAVGIPDANYFSRRFRRKFGLPPSKSVGEGR